MSLLMKGKRKGREIVEVKPAASGLRYVGFSAHRLAEGESLELKAPAGRELCAVVLEGIVTVRSGAAEFERIGKRRSVFEDQPPYAVYLPGTAPLSVKAHSDAEIAIGTAPGSGRLAPRLITPATMRRSVRGRELNPRYVTDILPEPEPADRLPDWVKFAPASDGGVWPVVRVAHVPADGGYSVRSFGADGRLLAVTLPIPAAPGAPGPTRSPAAAGWF